MTVSPAVMEMCRVMKARAEHGDFTVLDVVDELMPPSKGRSQKTARGDLRQRFARLVRLGAAVETVPHNAAAALGAKYNVGPSLEALLAGDLERAKSLAVCPAPPDLFLAWGIQLPTGFYAKPYPHSKVYRQRME